MKKFLAVLGSALMGTMLATAAYAAKETVTAEVAFAVPVSIAPVNQLQFGVLDVALLSTESITIAPDGTVTGDIARITGGVQAAADLLVTATAAVTVSILVDNVIETGVGYTLDTFMCNYDGAGVDSVCDGAGYTDSGVGGTATLLIGATLNGTVAGASVGTFNGSFDVTVLYQ
jgi:hypothetical protein